MEAIISQNGPADGAVGRALLVPLRIFNAFTEYSHFFPEIPYNMVHKLKQSREGGAMKTQRRKRSGLVPRETVLPLAITAAVHLLAYYLPKLLTQGKTHHTMTTHWDRQLPLVPAFISVYILAYVQWIGRYIRLARRDIKALRQVARASVIAELLAACVYTLFPTTLHRPEITGTGLWARLTRLIYQADTPQCLFPSMHCLQSWLCFRGTTLSRGIGRLEQGASLAFTLLVCASTVLVGQHVLVDIPAGILFAEGGLWLSRRLERRQHSDLQEENR